MERTVEKVGWGVATRSAASDALAAFLPRAGREYAASRNYDFGPGDRSNVSMLSPWIRVRLLSESEVLRAVLGRHSARSAEKFIQEVCWRTYWKGWLCQRPGIWDDYLAARSRLLAEFAGDAVYEGALAGRTGLACYDAWVGELVGTGYLHNHARMWFASIWVHTFGLPWELGADFFLRHLLDGDAASNTLGWRWVAGLQTPGKCYLAAADNIRKFTGGRFRPAASDLATRPRLPNPFPTPPAPCGPPRLTRPPTTGRMGLLIGDDDTGAARWMARAVRPVAVATLSPVASYRHLLVDDRVIRFRLDALRDAAEDTGLPVTRLDPRDPEGSIDQWVDEAGLESIGMAEPAVGFWNQALAEIRAHAGARGVGLHLLRRPWDDFLYPGATRGFFRMRRRIAEALDTIGHLD